MNELIAKPLAIATCGVFNMKRRAKEALRANVWTERSKTLN